jgi:hypothetical protein
VLGERVPPWGPHRSDKAGLDPWVPRALANSALVPFGRGVLIVAGSGASLLDQLDQDLKIGLHESNGK